MTSEETRAGQARLVEEIWSDMAQYLLAYLSSDFDDDAISALRSTASELADKFHWTFGAPSFIDESDDTSSTRSDDEPIRTVGIALTVSSPDEKPETSLAEVTEFVDAIVDFSRATHVELELELDDTYVGSIVDGQADDLVRTGLLANW